MLTLQTPHQSLKEMENIPVKDIPPKKEVVDKKDNARSLAVGDTPLLEHAGALYYKDTYIVGG